MNIVIIGVDPSSRKLAAVASVLDDETDARTHRMALPKNKPEACLAAYNWMRDLVDTWQRDCGPNTQVFVYVEDPVFGRGGPGSTIPQARINGCLLAGAFDAGADVNMVNNAHVKKEVVGRGNANKEDIVHWLRQAWPAMYETVGKDQDLADSAMIYVYGRQVQHRVQRIKRRKAKTGRSVGGASIRRRKAKVPSKSTARKITRRIVSRSA